MLSEIKSIANIGKTLTFGYILMGVLSKIGVMFATVAGKTCGIIAYLWRRFVSKNSTTEIVPRSYEVTALVDYQKIVNSFNAGEQLAIKDVLRTHQSGQAATKNQMDAVEQITKKYSNRGGVN